MELKNLIREGVVSSVNPAECMARVTFPDKDNLVSAELPILQPTGFRNKFYSLPDVGDEVVCLMAPNADDGTGYILGSRYHDKCPPPADSQDISMIRFDDGTFIKYDRAEHELRIECVGNIVINGEKIYLNE